MFLADLDPESGATRSVLVLREDDELDLSCLHRGHTVASAAWYQNGELRAYHNGSFSDNEEQRSARRLFNRTLSFSSAHARRRHSGEWQCVIHQYQNLTGDTTLVEDYTTRVLVRG